jgi:hypothetical protein
MPTQVTIIRAAEFVVATPDGRVDFPESQRILVKIAEALTKFDFHEMLLDMRKAASELSASQLWYLAKELSDHHTAFSGKLAVLCQLSRSSQAEFFALCAQNRGFSIKAFTSFEDAVKWLSLNEPGAIEEIDEPLEPS